MQFLFHSSCLLLLSALLGPINVGAQSLVLKQIPPAGSTGTILGEAHAIDPAKYGVLTFFDVFGTLWVKPTFDQPITRIQSDGTFSIALQNVGQDPCAGRIIALAVPLNYHVPIQTSVSVIPPEVEAVAIAKTIAERGFTKTITAFGYTFVVKDTASCVWGPGPNYFTSNNVRLDSDGKLHLTLSYVNGVWRAAEVISDQTLGYGTYKFVIDADFDSFPAPIVAGGFLYDDAAPLSHREMDFEYSKGAVVGVPTPFQFMIFPLPADRPSAVTGQFRHRYSLPAGTHHLIHVLTWLPGMVSFATYTAYSVPAGYAYGYNLDKGFLTGPPAPRVIANSIQVLSPTNSVLVDTSTKNGAPAWYYQARLKSVEEIGAGTPVEKWSPNPPTVIATYPANDELLYGVPLSGGEKLHFNIWLDQGQSPGSTNKIYEAVISDFKFTPIDPRSVQKPRLDPKKPEQGQPPQIQFSYPAN